MLGAQADGVANSWTGRFQVRGKATSHRLYAPVATCSALHKCHPVIWPLQRLRNIVRTQNDIGCDPLGIGRSQLEVTVGLQNTASLTGEFFPSQDPLWREMCLAIYWTCEHSLSPDQTRPVPLYIDFLAQDTRRCHSI